MSLVHKAREAGAAAWLGAKGKLGLLEAMDAAMSFLLDELEDLIEDPDVDTGQVHSFIVDRRAELTVKAGVRS